MRFCATLYLFISIIYFIFQALDFISENRGDFGLRMLKRLPVSGAFHTRLMYPAREALRKALGEINLQTPIIPVHSNVTSRPHFNTPEKISRSLVQQLTEPVKWEQISNLVKQ